MKHSYSFSLALAAGLLFSVNVDAQVTYSEGFDDLSQNGWTVTNNSVPLGTTQWAQGDGTIGVDTGHSGDSTSYATDGYTATDANGSGTISDWIISPATMIDNGDSLSLWTISYNSVTYADRIEVRISPNGGNDVGSDETSVGDFTNLVFTVNPDLDNTSYPSVTTNNDTWTYFGDVVSGLSGPTSCRIAVRYYIADGGGTGSNGSSIGIDDVTVTTNVAGINELSLEGVAVSPNPTSDRLNVHLPGQGNYDVTLVDATGRKMLMDHMNTNGSMDLSTFSDGVYMLEVRDVMTNAVSRQRVVKH